MGFVLSTLSAFLVHDHYIMNDLTELERRLVEVCRNGEPLICAAGVSEGIRADVVRMLCLGLRPEWSAPRGVQIKSATIVGQLDLQDRQMSGRLILEECVLADGINVCFSSLLLIDLTRSKLGPVLASRALVKHNFIMGNAVVQGRVDLRQAVIEGQLYADGLRIAGKPGDVAVRADGVRVDGDVFLRRWDIQGEVRFPGSQVGGNFECDGAILANVGTIALNIAGISVGGSVFLRADKSQSSRAAVPL
jgi:hypothetical protein